MVAILKVSDRIVRWSGALLCGAIFLYCAASLIALSSALLAYQRADCTLYEEFYSSRSWNLFGSELAAIGIAKADCHNGTDPTTEHHHESAALVTERNVLLFMDILICGMIHLNGLFATATRRWDAMVVFLTSWTVYFGFSVIINFVAFAFPLDASQWIPIIPIAMTSLRWFGIAAFACLFWTVDRRSLLLDRIRREVLLERAGSHRSQ